jgi:3-methyl-2-oxobutanoate hydroxymethyltransferase
MASSTLSRSFLRHLRDGMPTSQPTRKFATKVSTLSLASKKRKGRKICMVTAYDYPSAVHCARAEIDIILVGDSVAMVELGYDTTQPVTMEQMLHHCQAVKRGIEQSHAETVPLLVGDMPFGSYEFEDTDVALRNAYKFVKQAGVDAVKMEVRLPACRMLSMIFQPYHFASHWFFRVAVKLEHEQPRW